MIDVNVIDIALSNLLSNSFDSGESLLLVFFDFISISSSQDVNNFAVRVLHDVNTRRVWQSLKFLMNCIQVHHLGG